MALKSDIDAYEKGLQISIENRDPFGIANYNELLGDAYFSSWKYETAIEYYKKSLEIYSDIGHLSERIQSNLKLGTTYYKLAKYPAAMECFEDSLEIGTTIGDPSGMASSNCSLGDVYRSIGQYKEAIDFYEEGLKISTAIGERSGIACNNSRLGIAYCNLGEYQKAINHGQKALETHTSIGDKLGIACDNDNLGSAYRNMGEYVKAISFCKKSLEISTAIGSRPEIAITNCNLGCAYFALRDYEKAINHFEKSLAISTAISHRSGIATNIGNLGKVYLRFGEYRKAISHFKEALEICIAIGDRLGIATINGSFGEAYKCLGEYQEAINYHDKALEINTAIGNKSGVASNIGYLGVLYRNLGEHEKAINYFENALEIDTAIGNKSGISTNNGGLGNAYLLSGEYQKAINHYVRALEISTAVGDKLCMAGQNYNLGSTYLILEEYQKAIHYDEKALEINTAIGDQLGMAGGKVGLGITYFFSGEYKRASAYLVKAIRVFDKMFFNFVPDRNKLFFTAQYFISHRLLMSCFLFLERPKSALLVIDLGKCKELHFCIEKHTNCLDTEMCDFTCSIWNRISACEEEIQVEEIQQILYKEKNYSSILVFAFDCKGFLNIWILNESLVVKKVNADSDNLFLLISQLLKKLSVNVDRNSSFHRIHSDVSTFFPMIRKPQPKGAAGRVSNSGSVPTQEILGKLLQLLIDPLKDSLKGNKLIVVPDQQLFFVPFPSLVDEGGHFLTSKYSIQITPSLHTLRASMQRDHGSNFGFALFVGNPTADLPCAGEEVEYLANLFHATPLLGHEAKKQVVMQLLGQASIIHIAAHGEPTSGEILLSPNSSQNQSSSPVDESDSYLLKQRDVTNISVQARLVVLCCCYTGKGKVTSEGVIGITRSFLAAGARSVLSTLWPIDDEATKEFMKMFYNELCNETPVCEALRRTMVLFQNHEKSEFRSSRIWAPFTIYGEDVKFEKHEIEEIRGRSREFFSGFVVLP